MVNHDHRQVSDVLVEGEVITQVAPSITVRPHAKSYVSWDRCRKLSGSSVQHGARSYKPRSHVGPREMQGDQCVRGVRHARRNRSTHTPGDAIHGHSGGR